MLGPKDRSNATEGGIVNHYWLRHFVHSSGSECNKVGFSAGGDSVHFEVGSQGFERNWLTVETGAEVT